ncbi:unnamed protein product [Cylindrotheca closterium]|uniref:Protein ENHANCED DISEASE RESISTANCE 2 C-terminal domain-containing protein n=1 Tax=Cylindrotheca closterium TaxID=2856 RepID=A0AAD2FSP8_9STRA|nr:unnamed protein product [Cylindrotheca closterium]
MTQMDDSNFDSPLLKALLEKRVQAQIIDVDYYRIGGGLAVETDYIIRVTPTKDPFRGPQFESFNLSKTYSAFRSFGHQLKSAAAFVANKENLSTSDCRLVQYCETVIHLVETQRVTYLGKVNYGYVRGLAKKRSLLIDQVLAATLNFFPENLNDEFHAEIANTIQTFFLSDHCMEESSYHGPPSSPVATPSVEESKTSENQFTFDSPAKIIHGVGNAVGGVVGGAVGNVIAVGDFLKSSIIGDETPRNGDAQSPMNVTITSTAHTLRSPVVPYTRKSRRRLEVRALDEDELKQVGTEANLLVDDDRAPVEMVPSYSHPVSNYSSTGSRIGDLLDTNPFVFLLIGMAAAHMVKKATTFTVSMDLDILLLLTWAAFCIGLHTPRPLVSGVDKSNKPSSAVKVRPQLRRGPERSGRTLLRMAMVSTPDNNSRHHSFTSEQQIQSIREEEADSNAMLVSIQPPLPKFPDGAELGSKLNCWSEPVHTEFQVRGAKYLEDRKKISSEPFLFPIRAVDLFLTDACPQNAGTNPRILGGELRKVPTFLLNFRLPWGVLLAYFEIPERFVPFVLAGHDPDFDESALPSMDDFSASDRCVARFLQGSVNHKNTTLKIVPSVVEGPWVVKSVVGGKPAIIGNKMPVSYYYQKAEGDKALYLEADFDIVASSAARGILSCVRSYTQVLTLDLGFVVQGNGEDELPEQMLVGVRLHGIDPLTAPPYPSPNDLFSIQSAGASDDEDDDSGISSTI